MTRSRGVAALALLLAVLVAILVALVASPPQRAEAAIVFGPGGVTVSGRGVGDLVVVVGDERYELDVDGTFTRLLPAGSEETVVVTLDGETLARRP
jgi:hypothetical protein